MSSRIPVPQVPDLGAYLRDQRESAQLSLRQLADRSGISNPYLSQIERGLKRPSAEILQALAKGLQISAEQLYVHAGILEADDKTVTPDVRSAINADMRLTPKQRRLLLDVYASLVGEEDPVVATPAQAPQGDVAVGNPVPAATEDQD